MNAKVIKVAFANPPREGKKRATVKTDKDELFLVRPEKLGLFRPGKSYRVEFSTFTHQGKEYQTIEKVEPLDEPAQASPAAIGADAEHVFVTSTLAAMITAQATVNREDELATTVRMLRGVYRKGFA